MKKHFRLIAGVIVAAGVCAAGAVMDIAKVIHPSEMLAGRYEVRGVDVSAYQGDIHWDTLAGQDISFAYIKATEGSSFVDDRFGENLEGALGTDLKVGAYHFFSYDSSGAEQAQSFINTVPKTAGMLPPVIDLEFYGDYVKDPAGKDRVLPELRAMADALEEHYGVSPVIYVTGKAYRLYIKGSDLGDCKLWIRDVYLAPAGKDWTFWQYRDDAVLEGYGGEEKYIDLDVYCGSEEELEELCIR